MSALRPFAARVRGVLARQAKKKPELLCVNSATKVEERERKRLCIARDISKQGRSRGGG